MALNKNLFSTYFEYKDYNRCISMLREEIIHILVKRIQEKILTINILLFLI